MTKSQEDTPFSLQRLLPLLTGTVLYSVGINMFVTPAQLYSAGILGLCQILRTVMEQYLHIDFGDIDIAPIIYYLINVPIMVLAWVKLNRWFVIRTLLCLTVSTVFMAFIPTTPLLQGDITGLPVQIPTEKEAACLGAAMIAAVADGKFADFSEAAKYCTATANSYKPNPSEKTKAKYRRFCKLYDATLEVGRV